jgi:hypothetical protein
MSWKPARPSGRSTIALNDRVYFAAKVLLGLPQVVVDLHAIAGLDIQPHQREKLERLCRYVSRPPMAVERLALTSRGQVLYQLKTAYRDGTTHIVLEPLDLMARLAALVPPPRMHLTRFHGVFAPHSQLRSAVTPARRGWVARQIQPPPTNPSPRAMWR